MLEPEKQIKNHFLHLDFQNMSCFELILFHVVRLWRKNFTMGQILNWIFHGFVRLWNQFFLKNQTFNQKFKNL